MNTNYTSIEQVRSLVKLGLDPNTADMRNVMEAAVRMAERLLDCKSTYLKDNPNKMLGELK